MPTIPRAAPNTSVVRGTPGTQSSGMPRVAEAAGELARAGFNVYANMREQRQNDEIMSKEIETRRRLGALTEDINQGAFQKQEDGSFAAANKGTGHYADAPDAYEAMQADLRNQILADVHSERAQAKVGYTFDRISLAKGAIVRNTAVKRQNDATVANLDVNSEILQEQYANATTDVERENILLSFRDNLGMAVKTYAITKEDAVSRAQKFRNGVSELEVRKALAGSIRSVDDTETVLKDLRTGGYPNLSAGARQKFEEQALRQLNSAINYEWTMQQRNEMLARRELKDKQAQNTRDLAAQVRPVENGVYGAPKIGQPEIDVAFQNGEISSAQANYLKALIENPEPHPDPMTRYSWRLRLTANAYNGTLDENELLYARTQGYLKDEDVANIISIHESRQAAGGETATTDAKRALEFVSSYLYGVKNLLNVQLENDDVRELGVMELEFQGRVGRGENPYTVAEDLIDTNAQDTVTVDDLPNIAGIQDMFLRHQREGTLEAFWTEARQALMDYQPHGNVSPEILKGMARQLETLRQKTGKKLRRMPAIRQELRKRAAEYEKRTKK